MSFVEAAKISISILNYLHTVIRRKFNVRDSFVFIVKIFVHHYNNQCCKFEIVGIKNVEIIINQIFKKEEQNKTS